MRQLAETATPVDTRFDNLNRWTFLMMQAFEARSFLSMAGSKHQMHTMASMEDLLTQQALLKGFLLSYAKCFSSTGKGRIKLDPAKVFKNDQKLIPTHGRIMTLRHEFAAHGAASGLDEATISVQELDDHFKIRHLYALAIPLDEYNDYTDAINALDNHIVIGVNKAIDSLEQQLGKKIVLQSQE
ncbi:hypothetical protein [Pseudomonas protegens]|uniref:hypothetical protein n=1 Tax=Pseudomonas protegens TaxID=380021 RepID=UPI003828E3DE